jgi:hypothetical protein
MKAGDFCIASPNNFADLASPSALMIVLFLSWIAYSTKYLALFAYCNAICFSSIDFENSAPKLMSVMETSSKIIMNSADLSSKVFLIK